MVGDQKAGNKRKKCKQPHSVNLMVDIVAKLIDT